MTKQRFPISKNTYINANGEDLKNIQYDIYLAIWNRLDELDRRPTYDKILSFIGGIVGGIISWFSMHLGIR